MEDEEDLSDNSYEESDTEYKDDLNSNPNNPNGISKLYSKGHWTKEEVIILYFICNIGFKIV
jgi:hypothetical protein